MAQSPKPSVVLQGEAEGTLEIGGKTCLSPQIYCTLGASRVFPRSLRWQSLSHSHMAPKLLALVENYRYLKKKKIVSVRFYTNSD